MICEYENPLPVVEEEVEDTDYNLLIKVEKTAGALSAPKSTRPQIKQEMSASSAKASSVSKASSSKTPSTSRVSTPRNKPTLGIPQRADRQRPAVEQSQKD